MATTIDLGKVVPEKGIDYFTQADKTEIQTAVETNLQPELAEKELKANKTPIIDENSTEDQYPEAPAVYNKLVEQDEKIAELEEQNAMLIEQIPTATATGNPINVQDSSNLPIKDFKLKGNCGKNLLPTQANYWEQGSLGSSTGEPTTSTTRIRTKEFIPISEGAYYLSIQNSSYYFLNMHFYDKNKNWLQGTYPLDGLATKELSSIPNEAEFFRVVLRNATGTNTIQPSEVENIGVMVELGTTATEYEPYKDVTGDVTVVVNGKQLFQDEYILAPTSNTINAILPAGTYTLATCDGNGFGKNIYIRLFDNNGNIVTTSGHLTASNTTLNFSSSSYTYYGGAGASYITFTLDSGYKLNIGLLEAAGTRKVMLVRGSTIERTYEPYIEQTQLLSLGDTHLGPTDEIGLVNGVWCVNETPITDTTLKGQLENIPNLHTYKNTTNILSTVPAGNVEPIYEITYYQDLETLLNNYETRIELLETE